LDLDLLHSPRSEHQNPANVRAEKLSGKIKKKWKTREKEKSRGLARRYPKDGTAKCFWPIGHTRLVGHQVRIMSGI